MGNTLSPEVIRAFSRELEKTAIQLPGLRAAAKRFGDGIGSAVRQGWHALSPTNNLSAGREVAKDLGRQVRVTRSAEEALRTGARVNPLDHEGNVIKGVFGRSLESDPSSRFGRFRAHAQSALGAGAHLDPDAELSKGVKGVAERLSRGGWTGEGRLTKYVPIGQKGQLATGAVSAVPGIYRATKEGPDEHRGGVGEQTGNLLGYSTGAIMTAAMPNASFVAPILGAIGGGRLGRALDRRFDPRVRNAQGQEVTST